MQKATEGQIDAALDIVSAIKPKREYDERRRLNRGLDAEGRPVLEGRMFYPILSTPSRIPMRLRVADDGTVYATQED